MRIIYLHPHFTKPGGAGRMVIETAKRLAARGHEVHVICIRAEPAMVADAGPQVRFWEIGGPLSSKILFWVRFNFGCKRVLQTFDQIASQESHAPTILFPQVFPANWWGSYILKRRPKVVAHWYCQEPSAFIHSPAWIKSLPWPKNWLAQCLQPILQIIDLRACQRYQSVMVNSKFSQAYSQKIYGYPDAQCQVVYLGVNQTVDPALMNRERLPWITTVGKLTRFKNIDKLIEATRILVEGGLKDVILNVVGTGDALPYYQGLTENLQLMDHVKFHGELTDRETAELIAQSRVFCLASVQEPFGLVVIEALACGTPVIAVNSGGPQEILSNYNCGYLVPTGSATEFAEAARAILLDTEGFIHMSDQARSRAKSFDWNLTTDRLEETFRHSIVSENFVTQPSRSS